MCNVCDDTGFYRYDVPLGDPRFGKLIRCGCKANEDAKRLQRLSGLTDFERSQTLDHIETEDRPGTMAMVMHCKRFIKFPNTMLTLWGGSGNAKSMALQSVVNHFVDDHVEAIYITAFDLISYIRAAFQKSSGNDLTIKDDSAYQRLAQFERVRILAIDEFDKVRVTDWVQEQLTDLVDRRYRLAMDERAGTLIAMNDDPRNLPSWMYSRLAQNVIVHNSDSDMRPQMGDVLFTIPQTGEIIS